MVSVTATAAVEVDAVPTTRTDTLAAADVLAMAGCSYRQLDYWCKTYGLCADTDARQGRPRRFTVDEARAVTALAALGRHGIPVGAVAVPIVTALRRHPGASYLVVSGGQVTAHDYADDALIAALEAFDAATVVPMVPAHLAIIPTPRSRT